MVAETPSDQGQLLAAAVLDRYGRLPPLIVVSLLAGLMRYLGQLPPRQGREHTTDLTPKDAEA